MKYDNVSCSQCGRDFGPGDHGFSHCDQHPGFAQDVAEWRNQLTKIASMIIGDADEMDYRYYDPQLLAQSLRLHISELRDIANEMDPPKRRKKA